MNNYRAIDREEIQFDFLVFIENEYQYTEEIERMGGRVFFGRTPSVKNLVSFMNSVYKTIKEHGPYIAVHSHVNIANSWVLKAAKKANVPVRISHSHATSGMDGNWVKKMYRCIQLQVIKNNATHFWACGAEAGEYLYGNRFFASYGEVINNGINIDIFLNENIDKVEQLKYDFACEEAEMIIGNISRFDDNKNQMFILEVFRYLLLIVPSAVLLLGGVDGGRLNEVKERAETLQIDGNVRFIGKRKDIPDCLKLIDVYIFPSISEGLSIGLLEAQASGCLCFVSDSVSKEVDMGIGNIHFLNLQLSPQIWAECIEKIYREYTTPAMHIILQCFAHKGYLIRDSAKKLSKKYSGK